MDKIRYFTENDIINIYKPQHLPGMYRVEWNEVYIGYIYVCDFDEERGAPVWAATTEYARVYVEELGKLIEANDMML
jgi:hypothetical protein